MLQDENKQKPVRTSPARTVTRIATMSALLIVGKLALSFIPNVEVITTLTLVFACVFGYWAVAATTVFCVVDMFLYPFSPDVAIAYFIYWNLLALVAAVVSRRGITETWVYIIIGAAGTLLFGLLTTLTHTLFYSTPFWAVYVSGLGFYAVQLIGSTAFTLVGFSLLTKLLSKL